VDQAQPSAPPVKITEGLPIFMFGGTFGFTF